MAPLEFCDVLLGHPYMWKHHVVYKSGPRTVIVTLGGKIYWILEIVAPNTVSQGRKISSHIKKLFLFTIVSKGKHQITSTPSTQGIYAHKTQEENIVVVSSSIRVPLRCKATHSRCSSKKNHPHNNYSPLGMPKKIILFN